MEANKRRGVYNTLGVDCHSQCPCLPTGLRLVHRLQPGGRHGPGGLAVRSWFPSVRKHLFYQTPDSRPHSFSSLVCTLTPLWQGYNTASSPPLFVGMLIFEGREGSKVNLAKYHLKNFKISRGAWWADGGSQAGDALTSSWTLFQSVLVGPTMATRQWKTLSDGDAGQGEEPQYK